MELLWALAADAPAVVIEANFRPYSEYEREAVRPCGAASRGALRLTVDVDAVAAAVRDSRDRMINLR